MDLTCAIAKELATGRTDGLDRLFAEEGVRPPRVAWNPGTEDLIPLLGRLLTHWNRLRGTAEFPEPRAVDPADLRFILGSLMLVDVGDGDGRGLPVFNYRLYGTRVADSYGRDMTGRTSADFDGWMGIFFTATYEAARRKRRPLYTEHEPRTPSDLILWRRLLLPLAGPDGAIVRFLVGNLAATAGAPYAPMLARRAAVTEPGG